MSRIAPLFAILALFALPACEDESEPDDSGWTFGSTGPDASGGYQDPCEGSPDTWDGVSTPQGSQCSEYGMVLEIESECWRDYFVCQENQAGTCSYYLGSSSYIGC